MLFSEMPVAQNRCRVSGPIATQNLDGANQCHGGARTDKSICKNEQFPLIDRRTGGETKDVRRPKTINPPQWRHSKIFFTQCFNQVPSVSRWSNILINRTHIRSERAFPSDGLHHVKSICKSWVFSSPCGAAARTFTCHRSNSRRFFEQLLNCKTENLVSWNSKRRCTFNS